MAEYAKKWIRLHPATLSSSEFVEIDSILGADFHDEDNATLSWDFSRNELNNSDSNIRTVLEEVKDKKGIREFEIVAENEDVKIVISGGDEGCWLRYESSAEALGDTLIKVRL